MPQEYHVYWNSQCKLCFKALWAKTPRQPKKDVNQECEDFSGKKGNLSYWPSFTIHPPLYMREIAAFVRLGFLQFSSIFASTLEVVPWSVVFLRSGSPNLGPEKDEWQIGIQEVRFFMFFLYFRVSWTRNCPMLAVITLAKFDDKIRLNFGKCHKNNSYHFHGATPPRLGFLAHPFSPFSPTLRAEARTQLQEKPFPCKKTISGQCPPTNLAEYYPAPISCQYR